MSEILVPIFYDGQDRKSTPIAAKSHKEIKQQRKAGQLDGWYQENGTVFVLCRATEVKLDPTSIAAGAGFDDTWRSLQSGYAGPLVMQMLTVRTQESGNESSLQ